MRSQVNLSTLVNALGINATTLKQWSGEKNNTTSSVNPPAEFVALPVEASMAVTPSSHCPSTQRLHLSCESDQGLRWCLQGDIHPEQLRTFIHALTVAQGASS